MEKLSPEDGARLTQVILEKDRGALSSWMTMPIVSKMHAEGRISDGQFSAMSQSFATAYNQGKLSDAQVSQFLQLSSLGDLAPGIARDQFTQMRSFLNAAGNTPEMNQFREKLAEKLLGTTLTSNGVSGNFHDSGLAMQIAADSGDPDMAARVFATVVERSGSTPELKQAATKKLLDAISQSSIGFRNSHGVVDTTNPLATLIGSVARQPSTQQWNDIAVSIARHAGSANDKSDAYYDMYSHKPVAETSAALSQLLSGSQGNAVLNALTVWDTTPVDGKSGHAQQYGVNAAQLGGLLRQTAFNPDNPQQASAMKAVQDWANVRKEFLNDPSKGPAGMTVSQARQDLSMLSGASMDSISGMKIDENNRAEATKQLIGFVVDMAVTVLPGGGAVSKLVNKADLTEMFGNNPAVGRLIDQALSQGDKLTTAQLTSLKDAIAKEVNGQNGDLKALQKTVGTFIQNSIASGLPKGPPESTQDDSYSVVVANSQVVQTEIDDVRGA